MILEAVILDVVPGRETEFESAFAQASPIIASRLSTRGMTFSGFTASSGSSPNIRSGRNYYTIFIIHSPLCSISNWHFKTRNKKSGITHERSNTALSITNLNPLGSLVENSFHRGQPGWQ